MQSEWIILLYRKKKLLDRKLHVTRPVGEDHDQVGRHQDGLLVAAEYKRMEKTRRRGGFLGGELLKRPEPDASYRTFEEEKKMKYLQLPFTSI